MKYRLGKTSKRRLQGLHIDLVLVVARAISITELDFTVLEGLRTQERQQELFDLGATKTLNSRHLTGHAVDLGAWVSGQVRWDWPLYDKIAKAMKRAANDLSIHLKWGGDWEDFKDGVHFELPWEHYPVIKS